MTDTAQLRKALDQFDAHAKSSATLRTFRPMAEAARELLTIREAGALIVTPDEGLVERIAQIISNYDFDNDCDLNHHRDEALDILDAFRDAMPDGLPADPRDLLTDDDREALQSDLDRLAKGRDAMPDGET